MYRTEDLVAFGKSIGDPKPKLPYCISTINEALSHGIRQYIANLIKGTPLVSKPNQTTSWADQLLVYWPDLRRDGFKRYQEMSKEKLTDKTMLGKAFNYRIDDLVKTAAVLNQKLAEVPAIAQTLDTMFGGQHDDIFPPKEEHETEYQSPIEFVILYDDLTHDIKGEHTTVDDIEFSKQMGKVGLNDPKVVNTFLSLSKDILRKDSKYKRYDMETEAFREAFPNAD